MGTNDQIKGLEKDKLNVHACCTYIFYEIIILVNTIVNSFDKESHCSCYTMNESDRFDIDLRASSGKQSTSSPTNPMDHLKKEQNHIKKRGTAKKNFQRINHKDECDSSLFCCFIQGIGFYSLHKRDRKMKGPRHHGSCCYVSECVCARIYLYLSYLYPIVAILSTPKKKVTKNIFSPWRRRRIISS